MNPAARNAQVPTWCGALVDAEFARRAFDDEHRTHATVTPPARWRRVCAAARTMWKRLPHRKES